MARRSGFSSSPPLQQPYYKKQDKCQAGESGKAGERFQQSVKHGEELVSFLFNNVDEAVYIIPQSYIFDYLEPLIIDARSQLDSLE